ncbi:MAG: hypothetical protein K0R98_640 [Rickettsiaceae bacterium]|jgi:predicted PurR-regulated permease PerM|nr:hypothetical protein [Rickettsiaceae bacterium]
MFSSLIVLHITIVIDLLGGIKVSNSKDLQDLNNYNEKLYMISQILAVISILLVLKLGLLPLLLAGLIIYHLVHGFAPLLVRIGIGPKIGHIISLVIIATVVTAGITVGCIALSSFVNNGSGSLSDLLQRMADTIDTAKSHFPIWVQNYLPNNVAELQDKAASLLREHATQLTHISKTIGTVVVYILIGMVIGGMVAFNPTKINLEQGPLSKLLEARVAMFSSSFKRIVFSQIKISAINTVLTSIFLVVILPMFDVHLPLTKTMIAITFIAGLLPVLGNLISNTVIVLIALGISPAVAFSALAFLVIIHKLEYFLNAKIIGTHIKARAWEILLAMLVMEATFGIDGVIAAPIYYSYLKDELTARKLI